MKFETNKEINPINIIELAERVSILEEQMRQMAHEEKVKSIRTNQKEKGVGAPTCKVFMPEVDYLIWVTLQRNEFRKGVYDAGGRAHMSADMPAYTYGYYIEGLNSAEVLIAGKLMTKDTTMTYLAPYKYDYRVGKFRSAYMKGAMTGNMDGGKEIAEGTMSALAINWSAELTPEVLDATRTYWESIKEQEEVKRICNKATMLRLCDLLEAGKLDAGNIPWVVEQPRDSITPDLLPLKITLPDDYMDSEIHSTVHKDEDEDEWEALMR